MFARPPLRDGSDPSLFHAKRRATYEDRLAVPERLVAEIIDGVGAHSHVAR